MTTEKRTVPNTLAGERDGLEEWLEFHRETLAVKCRGLDGKQLREATVPPSELSLLGLVRHMAEVERHWFRRILTDEEPGPLYCTDEDEDGDFHPGEGDTWEEAYATWQEEIVRARELAAERATLDEVSLGQHPRTGKRYNLRWIYIHMIEEYARHNGHADFLRERIDGATGD